MAFFFRYNYLVQFAPLDGFCRPLIVTPGIAAAYVASRCQTFVVLSFAVNLDTLDAEVADGIHLLVQLEVEVIARQRLVEEESNYSSKGCIRTSYRCTSLMLRFGADDWRLS